MRRPLPGSSSSSSRSAVIIRQQSSRAAAQAKAEDAAARAARLPRSKRGSRPLAGPRTLPTKRVGLYDPALEKDSCGVGLAVQMKSVASRQVKPRKQTTRLKAARVLYAALILLCMYKYTMTRRQFLCSTL